MIHPTWIVDSRLKGPASVSELRPYFHPVHRSRRLESPVYPLKVYFPEVFPSSHRQSNLQGRADAGFADTRAAKALWWVGVINIRVDDEGEQNELVWDGSS